VRSSPLAKSYKKTNNDMIMSNVSGVEGLSASYPESVDIRRQGVAGLQVVVVRVVRPRHQRAHLIATLSAEKFVDGSHREL
jgi:hypothetical protein